MIKRLFLVISVGSPALLPPLQKTQLIVAMRHPNKTDCVAIDGWWILLFSLSARYIQRIFSHEHLIDNVIDVKNRPSFIWDQNIGEYGSKNTAYTVL